MNRPEFLNATTVGQAREEYRKNIKALNNTMMLVMTGIWEESKSIAGEVALNRGLTELITQQEYIRERERESWAWNRENKKGEIDMKRKMIVMSETGEKIVEYDKEMIKSVRIGKAEREYGSEYCELKGIEEDAAMTIIEFKDGTEIGFERDKTKKKIEGMSEEEELETIWQQVKEKAVEKIEKIMVAIENRDKSAMDKATEEYNRFLSKLSETLEMEEKELDDRFASLWWSRQQKNE